jgi:hypothetical protein
MKDTETSAMRRVANGDLFLRRPDGHSMWEVAAFHRDPVFAAGIMLWDSVRRHPMLERSFATPEEAVRYLAPVLA